MISAAAVVEGIRQKEAVFGDTPGVVMARTTLDQRLRSIIRLLPRAARQAHEDVEHVHRLRVATRRLAAALRLFSGYIDPVLARDLRRRLRRVRRACSVARADDVQLAFLQSEGSRVAETQRADWESWLKHVEDSRRRAQKDVRAVGRPQELRKWKFLRRCVRRSLWEPRPFTDPSPRRDREDSGREKRRIDEETDRAYTLSELAVSVLPPMVEPLRSWANDAEPSIEALHSLRIAGKRLRYAMEMLTPCFSGRTRDELYRRLRDIQDRLGSINDLWDLVTRLREMRDGLVPGEQGRDRNGSGTRSARSIQVDPSFLDRRLAEYEASLARDARAFTSWWSDSAQRSFVDDIMVQLDALPQARGRPGSHGSNGRTNPTVAESMPVTTGKRGNGRETVHHRIAAIDVGSNSIRLVVAESDPVSRFHVIEDIRETTRLGSGVYSGGRLSCESIRTSIQALKRMTDVARAHHVSRLRAVGTSAVREAANGPAFIDQVRSELDLDLEPIDGDYEARLAFSSVVSAYDLDDCRFATVDLGGGSAELVFSNGGLVNRIVKLPLGAVRLSSQIGPIDAWSDEAFRRLRDRVDRIIAEHVTGSNAPLELIVGTGGTFTTLAKVALRGGGHNVGEGRFPFALRGFETSRHAVGQLLDRLRLMTLDQRRRVPGMGDRRAEIIVPGLCVVERLLNHLGVERLRVHDGGIRDGLLTEMLDEMGLGVARRSTALRQTLAAVRRFAERCGYDKPHSEHVARLSLRILDQLEAQTPDAASTWASRNARGLLQAAAVLHDVGLLISLRRHHRHSYDMITHAHLPALSRHAIELIALIARYHRGRGPSSEHPSFAKLGDDDRRLVAHLAGILRIADGLDRLHTQNVVDVFVRVTEVGVHFDVHADGDPCVNLHYAARKADVFEGAFFTGTQFGWVTPPPLDAWELRAP